MTTTVRPIPTQHRGVTFRSRLEARTAVFLDVLGCRWSYEPEGFQGFTSAPGRGRYLPDFYVHDLPGRLSKGRSIPVWLEVKGQEPTRDETNLLRELCCATGTYGLFIVGTSLWSGLTADDVDAEVVNYRLGWQVPHSVFAPIDPDGHCTWQGRESDPNDDGSFWGELNSLQSAVWSFFSEHHHGKAARAALTADFGLRTV